MRNSLILPPKGRGAVILSAATVVGRKEHDGPLGGCFDFHGEDDRFGQDTWERAESEMQRMALGAALGKAGLVPEDVDFLLAGDLLNQCVGSAYGLVSYPIPYLGLYGACSTSAEGLLLASALVLGGQAEVAAAVTSSHNAAAERQFRSPIEYGGQRPPTGQWTVTGAGGFVVCEESLAHGRGLGLVTGAMAGLVVDAGVKDPNNMGAAMAPAAASTILRYLEATGESPADLDLIVTGDLGWEGSAILRDLLAAEGVDIASRHTDCGMLIFSRTPQDTHSGGSGCGCAAVVLGSYLLPRLATGGLSRILFLATGAMMSPDSVKQGGSIPSVAHLVRLEGEGTLSPNGK